MHVALLIPGLDCVTGAEGQVLLLAHGLKKRGWRVTVIALSGNSSAAAQWLSDCGISFLSLRMRHGLADPRGWVRFCRWVRRERPDVVHTHLHHATWLARWSRLVAPIPLLIDTLHSSATGGITRRIGFQLSDWLSDRVTAVSHAAAEAHRSRRMVAPKKLEILPNGIKIHPPVKDARARLAARRSLGISGEFVWIAVGRLDPVKDYETLLRAMAQLPESASLWIAGSGRLEPVLKDLAASLSLGKRVRFLGYQNEPRHLMRAADAFVLNSLWEGLPVALLEAATCSLPTVATDVAGTREAVIPGETAWLVPPSAPDVLASAMRTLMELPVQERAALGNRARHHVVKHFDIELILNQWEAHYRRPGIRKGAVTTLPASFAPSSAGHSQPRELSRPG